ncbi:ubiquinol-cytochrome c reductase complex protein [Coccidioides immitis RS]|uniref:Cytochrome b-c1 complex subunit 7 n=6 Tax=Coccidioides TaxID=5500 RepID=J3KCT1_COCIM|nr:ubiquinol-cytochrome c reductase complex protein [Coccidioides immitis RS]KMM73441.1 cytochrome b-c1 complex subunit 7 [Coccidioides posadasii RMSCC 3488]KMP08369.1 cytochrome b-c1 complex subunit 7 [Coccidioides immitis RMSCC 2394]KMU72372.1 cytochrome b-c1 complex subunit 7 [Coccidioides immitis RMSCC 3703]KMU88695.1 cytochrome b-c1 complex subunit 7 [Coccidioides immitis H538.4]TPX20007.1 Cytochrome b-c1 complex subunit 7 [Coccidioides immitis]
MSLSNIVARTFEVPWVKRMAMPLAQWYTNAAGYRQMGLRYDDLIPEENDVVQQALKRLPPKEAYDRIYRLRRAFQLSLQQQILPVSEHTKPQEDVRYLRPLIEEVEREQKEREDLDAMVIKR